MLARVFLIFACTIALVSCSTKLTEKSLEEATTSPISNAQFENAIAKKLLHLAFIEIDNADKADRARTIELQLEKIERSTDGSQLSSHNQLQIRVMYSLLATTQANSTAPESKINEILQNSTLGLDGEDGIKLARSRLRNLQSKLRVLTGTEEDTALYSLLDSVRGDDESYESNTEQGRQEYLTLIVNKLIEVESLIPLLADLPEHAELNLMGFENGSSTVVPVYNYDESNATLEVDLTDMRQLPLFELESTALFYGVPGLHTLASMQSRFEIQSLQNLKNYENGWAAYINSNLDRIPLYQHPTKVRDRIYVEMFFVSMAIVDYNINTQSQMDKEAIGFLKANSPYPLARLERSLALAKQHPGRFFGQFMGLLEFEALRLKAERSLHEEFELVEFHNHIVEVGPLRFDELRGQMEKWINHRIYNDL